MKQAAYELHFTRGLRQGIPIALGYLSVSFGFGIAAVNRGRVANSSMREKFLQNFSQK